jgi:hypothetical protein
MALAVLTALAALRALTMKAAEAVKAVPITMVDLMALAVADLIALAVADLPHQDYRMEQAKRKCLRGLGTEPFRQPQPPNDRSDAGIRSGFLAMPGQSSRGWAIAADRELSACKSHRMPHALSVAFHEDDTQPPFPGGTMVVVVAVCAHIR